MRLFGWFRKRKIPPGIYLAGQQLDAHKYVFTGELPPPIGQARGNQFTFPAAAKPDLDSRPKPIPGRR